MMGFDKADTKAEREGALTAMVVTVTYRHIEELCYFFIFRSAWHGDRATSRCGTCIYT